jgi:hypothetical protein
MLVKDELDVIEHVVRYLARQVDEVIVADNESTDGTTERLYALRLEIPFHLRRDEAVGYYQAQKTSALAALALEMGHQWVVPCDADEVWYATDGRTIAQYLGGLAPDVAYVHADLYNHIPSAIDPPERCDCGWAEYRERPGGNYPAECARCLSTGGENNPFRRIGFRQREHGALPKVAARLRPGLEIRQGNHSAWAPGTGMTVRGLCVRHFSWRSAEQYERKIANGARAYAATNLPEGVGAHWRMFGSPDSPDFSERVQDHFRRWFWTANPHADSSLIFDPAPL